MTLSLHSITFDCGNALTMARFWAAATRHPIAEGASEDFASLAPSPPASPETWMFIRVPEGKSVKNRVHVDLSSDDRATEISRLVELGASRVGEHDENGIQWTVLSDPEGNEFCVV